MCKNLQVEPSRTPGNAAYRFFCHSGCEYFPCHPDIAPAEFNCLFCFCPLYALGENCGGAFTYTAAGYKDCSGCGFPHRRENYDAVLEKVAGLVERMGRRGGQD